MRTVMYSALFMAAGILAGCNSTMQTSSTPPAEMPANKVAAADSCMLQSAGVNVLKVATPERAKCESMDGSLFIKTPKYNVEFWVVNGAQTVDDALSRVPTQIVEEFKNFKPTSTTDLTINGSPAKRLQGSGLEADDGDPGEADVIVFKTGGHVFVACNHGEGLTPAGREGLLTLVQSAQRP